MKKWTYLVAAVLMSGTAPFFTSCIDNDEPEGITILRKAKAELISAKKAVADAEAAEKLAQAELAKADAEVKRAEAEIKKAQAELIKAQTEGEKAKIEAEIKKIEAEAQLVLAQAEAAAQAAADAHAEALKQLEILQATLQKEQQAALQTWIDRYDAAQKTADEKKLAYNKAQRAYTKALNDSKVYDEKDVEKMNEIKAEIRKAEKRVKDLKEIELAGLNAEMEAAKALKPGELPTRLEDVKKELDKLKADYANVELQIAEMKKNDPDVAKLAELEKKIAEIAEEKVIIKDFEVEYPEMGIPGLYGTEKAFGADLEYTLNDLLIYDYAKYVLTSKIEQLEGLKLDENDQAWTEQSIIDLEAGKKAITDNFEAAKESWQEAVNAYKTTDGSVNLEAFDTYAPLKAAVEAYNATLPAYNEAKEARDMAYQAWRDAIDKKDQTQTLTEIWQAEQDKAMEKLIATQNALDEEVNAKNESIYQETVKRENDIRGLYIVLQEKSLEYRKNPTEETLKAMNDAREAVQKGFDDLNKWKIEVNKELNQLIATNDTKKSEAQTQYQIDMLQAEKNYQDKLIEYGNEQKDPALQEAINAAKEVFDAKDKVYQDAKEVVDDAYDVLSDANYAFQTDINKYSYIPNWYEAYELTDIARLTRDEAKDLVLKRSLATWGSMVADNDADGQYGLPTEYLIGLDKEAVDAIIRSNYKDIKNWELNHFYNNANFGAFGDVLGYDYTIAVAKATLENGAALDAAIKQFSDNLKTITEAYDAQDAKFAEVKKSYEAQELVVEEKTQALTDRLGEIKSEQQLNSDIAAALQKAVEAAPFEDQFTQGAIDNYVAAIQTSIDAKNEEITVAEGNVEAKNQKLEDFKNGKLTAVNEANEAMEVAKEESELADKRAKDAKDELDKAIAKLEQSAE